jgi:hypothetical protein
MNGAATYVASGSYNNSFKVFKCTDGAQGIPLEASRDPMRRRLQPARVSAPRGAAQAGAWAAAAAGCECAELGCRNLQRVTTS